MEKPIVILRSTDEAREFIAQRKAAFLEKNPWYAETFEPQSGVLTGTFDAAHAKHAELIAEAKSHVDTLIVAVAPDSIAARKSTEHDKRPIFSAEDRATTIATHTKADAVLLVGEGETNPKALWSRVLDEIRPDFAFIGKDRKGEKLYTPEGTERVYIGSEVDDSAISTTRVVQRILDRKSDPAHQFPARIILSNSVPITLWDGNQVSITVGYTSHGPATVVTFSDPYAASSDTIMALLKQSPQMEEQHVYTTDNPPNVRFEALGDVADKIRSAVKDYMVLNGIVASVNAGDHTATIDTGVLNSDPNHSYRLLVGMEHQPSATPFPGRKA